MIRSIVASFLFVTVMMAGCTQTEVPVAADTEARHYAPEGNILLDSEGNGTSNSVPLSGWFVDVSDWSQSLALQDSALDLSIHVAGKWRQGLEPFEENEWMFRLHAESGAYNETRIYHKIRSLDPPSGVDWYRNYTLQGILNATVSHPTQYQIGNLTGEVISFRITYQKVHESGFWEAHECRARYMLQGGAYLLQDGTGHCQQICLSTGSRAPCPWSGEYGNSSPPPPPNW